MYHAAFVRQAATRRSVLQPTSASASPLPTLPESQKFTRWIIVLAATTVAVGVSWRILQPFVDVIVVATVLVVLFWPLREWLVRVTGSRPRAALICSVLLVVAILLPLALLAVAVARELAGATEAFTNGFQRVMSNPAYAERVQGVREYLRQYVDIDALLSAETLSSYAANSGQQVVKGTIGVVGGALELLLGVIFTIFAMYYLFRDGEQIRAALPKSLPLEPEQNEQLIMRTAEVIKASVWGVLVVASIQGFLGGVMFAILGLPSAIVWGVVMTMFCTIPLAGSGIVWVPAAIYLAVSGDWTKAIVLALWGAFVVGLVDNFLRPKLVGSRARMHELFIFFSVLGGLRVFGVLGVLLGPVTVAITLALLDVLRQAGESASKPAIKPDPAPALPKAESAQGHPG